jgi:hypothetical protein
MVKLIYEREHWLTKAEDNMKQMTLLKTLVAVCAMALGTAVAQESTTTTTTTNPVTGTTTESSTVTRQGTITAYTPSSDYITFRTTTDTAPVRYYYDKTTTILDPEGRTVTWSAIRPDLPATVYYVREGNRMIVRKIVLSQPGTVYEKTEQTTTTQPTTTTETTTTYAAGAVTTYEPGKTIVVKSDEGPVSFALGTAARIVDGAGKIITAPLRSGQKVRVYYTGPTEHRTVERVQVED